MSETLHKDITVYQQAIKVAAEAFKQTAKLPLQQRFVLTAQLRRSIILVCNQLAAVANSNCKISLKRNIEQFIKVYAETKTQIKMSLLLNHFEKGEMNALDVQLDQILQCCKSNLALYNN
jgi:four helix bundle protein